MHGGALYYSAATPVEVRRYYRSPWGSRRRRGLPVYGPQTREVTEALAEVELDAERIRRRLNARARRRARTAAAIAAAEGVEPVVVVRRRRRPRRRRRAIAVIPPAVPSTTVAEVAVPTRVTRRNLYYYRNAAGVRVAMPRRPPVV